MSPELTRANHFKRRSALLKLKKTSKTVIPPVLTAELIKGCLHIVLYYKLRYVINYYVSRGFVLYI